MRICFLCHTTSLRALPLIVGMAVAAGCSDSSGDLGSGGAGAVGGGAGGAAGAPDAPFLWQPIRLDNATDLGFAAAPIPTGDQVPPGTITLTEVGDQAGLGDSSASGNSHGVGVGFIDVDNDGFEDILLANGAGTNSELYRNDRDGTFTDVSVASGIVNILGGVDTYSVAAGDYDMDGDLDIYVGAHPNDVLLQNDGSGSFVDATSAAGAGGPASSQPGSASKIGAWGDYNGDGWLDIAVASSTFADQPENGYLLRNDGDGTFTDVTEETNFAAAPTGNPCAVLWSDYDSDGDQDVWVWNDRGSATENRVLLRNDGGVFSDVTVAAGITNSVSNPMGIDGADADHDGFLDYYISDINGNPFMHSNRNGTFSDIQNEAGAEGEFGWGLGFEDFNADTWPDIFVAQEDDADYLTFTNLGMSPPRFTEQRWKHAAVGNGHNVAVAFADYDHNGTIDIVTASTSGSRMNLYRNDTDLGSQTWLEVRVRSTPGTGSLGGISGRVVVKTGDVVQFRDLTGGSSRASQNAMSVRFGLGQWTGAEWVAILWPDGRQMAVLGVEGNQVLALP
ncbi:MAG: CRTAC1 family protein [Myxococcales bacterium]|nr:CRTAC1 family protein [Myxococcales bacterium]